MQKKRVMILGTTGSLGGYLADAFASTCELVSPLPRMADAASGIRGVSWLRTNFDLTDPHCIQLLLEEARPDAVVNCVAVTPRSSAYGNRRACLQTNSLFPHQLANAARSVGAYVVHISTDAVYSGARGFYSEDDEPDPVDLYGWTKLLGELEGEGCITLRTTFFGAFKTRVGLINSLLQHRSEPFHGYKNYRFSGLSASCLATVVSDLLHRASKLHGVFHVGSEPTTKLDLLKRVRQMLDLRMTIVPKEMPVIDRSLDSSRFWELLGRPRPTLQETLESMQPELHLARPLETSARPPQVSGWSAT